MKIQLKLKLIDPSSQALNGYRNLSMLQSFHVHAHSGIKIPNINKVSSPNKQEKKKWQVVKFNETLWPQAQCL